MAIIRIQSAADSSGAAAIALNAWSAVWPVNPNIGNFLVLGVVSLVDDVSPVVPGVIVTQSGVSWTFVSREVSAVGGGQYGVVLDVYYGSVLGPLVFPTISISYIGTDSIGCAVFAEYSGIASSLPLDVFFGRNGTDTPIPCGPTSFTSQRDELWSAFWCSENTRNTPSSATNGFSLVEAINLSAAPGFPDIPGEPAIGLGELIVTDRGFASSNAITVFADRESSIMATFKSGIPGDAPSGPEPGPTGSLIPNTDYVGQGLDRLAEQFKSGE